MEFHWIEIIGYCGTAATVVSYSMKTIVPLRIAGIASSVFFICYAWVVQSWPMLLTELLILPLNSLRLYQIMKLLRQVREASEGDHLVDWLEPFATRRSFEAGEIIFRRGDTADAMLLLHSGRYRLVEADIELEPGEIVGEMGFVTTEQRRTMTLECVEAGTAGRVSYPDLRQLYFQNPRFGYYLLRLLGTRLVARVGETNADPKGRTAPQPG